MGLDLLDPLGDQLGLDRLAVDVLHLPRGDVPGEGGDPLELRVGVLVAAVDALEVEHGEAAELADHPGRLGRDDAVEGGRQQRQLEAVGPERPGDVDVVGIARAPRGDDRDVVEAVGPAGLLAASDLYFHSGILGRGRVSGGAEAMTAATIGRSMLAAARRRLPDGPRAYARNCEDQRISAGSSQPLGLHLAEQPLDAAPGSIDAGAEMLRRLGAAGHPEAQAVDGRLRPM